MAISTQINNTLYERALGEAEKQRLAQIAQTQGAAAASSAYLQAMNQNGGAIGATPSATTGATGATTGAAAGGYGAGPIGADAMRQQAQGLHNAAQVLTSGNTAEINNYKISQARQNNPYQAAVAAATPSIGNPTGTVSPSTVQQKDYLLFGKQDPNFKVGMTDEDKASWNAIGQKYAAGDTSWNRDTNSFREDGNWSGYYDDNGNYNGWLMAVNKQFSPVFQLPQGGFLWQ